MDLEFLNPYVRYKCYSCGEYNNPEHRKGMLSITVLNHEKAEAFDPTKLRLVDVVSPAIISITCPGETANLKPGWAEILRLEFDDVVPEHGVPCESTPMTYAQAEEIVAFADKHNDKNLIVHCRAGVSRSVAVGMFLRHWPEKDSRSLWLQGSTVVTDFYNSHVHSQLMRVAYNTWYKVE